MYSNTIDIESYRDQVFETTYNGGTVTLRLNNGRTMTVTRGWGEELTEAGWPVHDDFVVALDGGSFRTVRGDNMNSIMNFLANYSFAWVRFDNTRRN